MRALLAWHTAETGQAFTADVLAAVWTRTVGQPWLVNALCRDACFDREESRDRSRLITADDVLDAKERLILARVTRLDALADKLREERVRRVVAPMLTGAADRGSYADRDEGVEQTLGYMDRRGAEAGHLIVFDPAPDRTWEDKLFHHPPAPGGAPVTVWGM